MVVMTCSYRCQSTTSMMHELNNLLQQHSHSQLSSIQQLSNQSDVAVANGATKRLANASVLLSNDRQQRDIKTYISMSSSPSSGLPYRRPLSSRTQRIEGRVRQRSSER